MAGRPGLGVFTVTDMFQLLVSLAAGVGDMGHGDPEAGERVAAADVIKWAVSEIRRLRTTAEERRVLQEVAD